MEDRRLYLFGIGGTGARVIKALTLLLAAGAEAKASQIVPIIIDPDRENGDLNRTIEIMELYQKLREQSHSPQSKFFKTELKTLASLERTVDGKNYKLSESFKFNIDGTKEGRFRDFIQYDQLSSASKKFTHLLFSEKNLNEDLTVGFKGNPNMGSVVLNQFKDSDDFRYFASNFRPKDRIFVISSIFGGTGAAGFPLIVNNIRQPDISGLSQGEHLKNARIGAITVLPYFGVEEKKGSAIAKGTFISKTKAALSYYIDGVNKSLNALYYIGDNYVKDYKNHEGRKEQKNEAHFVEMVAAMAVLDFLELEDGNLETENGVPKNSLFREFGIRGKEPTKLNFNHFGGKESRVFKPLVQFSYCAKYWKDQIKESISQQAWAKGKGSRHSITIDQSFLTNNFYNMELMQFVDRYFEWLREMDINQRSFTPFNLDTKNRLHNFVTEVEQNKVGWIRKSLEWDYSQFDEKLNETEMGLKELSIEQKFMALFYNASVKIFEERFS